VTDDPEELIVFGNHILRAQAFFPVRATHIEIWFRREREQDFTLMQRTALDSLLGWTESTRTYRSMLAVPVSYFVVN